MEGAPGRRLGRKASQQIEISEARCRKARSGNISHSCRRRCRVLVTQFVGFVPNPDEILEESRKPVDSAGDSYSMNQDFGETRLSQCRVGLWESQIVGNFTACILGVFRAHRR